MTSAMAFALLLLLAGVCLGAAAASYLHAQRDARAHAELYRLKDFHAALHLTEKGEELHLTIYYRSGDQAAALAQRVREGIEWALERGVHAQAARPRIVWGRR